MATKDEITLFKKGDKITSSNLNAPIVELADVVDNKVDKVAGKGLSSNDYTTSEKSKLAGLESSRWRGLFTATSQLPSPGLAGDYADVDAGSGQDVQRYIWDVSDSKWVAQSGIVTALTGAEIKQLYEAQPDTNAFSDGEKTKLSNLNQNSTDAQLRDRATHTGTQPVSTITGLGSAATRNVGTAVGNLLEHGSPYFGISSGSDFPDGTLIRTNIPAADTGGSISLMVRGKGYGNLPHLVTFEAYQYDGRWTSPNGVNYSGNINNITIMEFEGYVCFWFASTGYWNSFFVEVYNTTGVDYGNRAIAVVNSTQPSGTKIYTHPLTKTYNTTNLLNIGATAATARSAMGLGTASTTNVDWLLAQNVATASTLAGHQDNWANYRSNAVSNMLGWKAYGNGHVIFDASEGTAPNGAACSTHVADSAWAPTHPCLMGWNGSSTYGLRVDSARTADTILGFPLSGVVNNAPNQIVRTDGSGYLQTGYINTTNDVTIGAISNIYVETASDGYIRKCSPAHLKAQMGGGAVGEVDFITLDNNATAFTPAPGSSYGMTRTTNTQLTCTLYCTHAPSKLRSWHMIVSKGTGAGDNFIPKFALSGLTQPFAAWSGGGTSPPLVSNVSHVLISFTQIDQSVRAMVVDGW